MFNTHGCQFYKMAGCPNPKKFLENCSFRIWVHLIGFGFCFLFHFFLSLDTSWGLRFTYCSLSSPYHFMIRHPLSLLLPIRLIVPTPILNTSLFKLSSQLALVSSSFSDLSRARIFFKSSSHLASVSSSLSGPSQARVYIR